MPSDHFLVIVTKIFLSLIIIFPQQKTGEGNSMCFIGCPESEMIIRETPILRPTPRGMPHRDHCSVLPPSSHPHSFLPPVSLRMAGFDGSAWDEEEEEPPDHQYYNDFGEGTTSRGCGGHEEAGRSPPRGCSATPPSAQTPSHLGARWYVAWMEAGGAWMGAAG